MTPKEKAQQLYTNAYLRYCNELSHEKNFITAKDISQYICNEVLGYVAESKIKPDKNYIFWLKVKDIINKSNHKKLYKY